MKVLFYVRKVFFYVSMISFYVSMISFYVGTFFVYFKMVFMCVKMVFICGEMVFLIVRMVSSTNWFTKLTKLCSTFIKMKLTLPSLPFPSSPLPFNTKSRLKFDRHSLAAAALVNLWNSTIPLAEYTQFTLDTNTIQIQYS